MVHIPENVPHALSSVGLRHLAKHSRYTKPQFEYLGAKIRSHLLSNTATTTGTGTGAAGCHVGGPSALLNGTNATNTPHDEHMGDLATQLTKMTICGGADDLTAQLATMTLSSLATSGHNVPEGAVASWKSVLCENKTPFKTAHALSLKHSLTRHTGIQATTRVTQSKRHVMDLCINGMTSTGGDIHCCNNSIGGGGGDDDDDNGEGSEDDDDGGLHGMYGTNGQLPDPNTISGDERLALFRNMLDEFKWERQANQVDFHEQMIMTSLPCIFAKEWDTDYDRILRMFNAEREYAETFIICPRRFGKTVAVAMFAAVYMYVIPNASIAIFSTAQRTSGKMMLAIYNFMRELPYFPMAQFTVKNSETISISVNGVDRTMWSYPGTVAVCYLLSSFCCLSAALGYLILNVNFLHISLLEYMNWVVSQSL